MRINCQKISDFKSVDEKWRQAESFHRMWGWVTLSQGGVGASASARTSASASTSRLAPVHCREVLGFKGVSIALGFKGETCYQRHQTWWWWWWFCWSWWWFQHFNRLEIIPRRLVLFKLNIGAPNNGGYIDVDLRFVGHSRQELWLEIYFWQFPPLFLGPYIWTRFNEVFIPTFKCSQPLEVKFQLWSKMV